MAITDIEAKLDAARTRFIAQAGDIFSGPLPGTWNLIADRLDAPDGKVTLLDAGPSRGMRRWVGEKQFGAFRLYDKSIKTEPNEASFEIRRTDLSRDSIGVINKRIDTFITDQSDEFDYEVWDSLLSNPTGIDGVALLANSHPFGNGGTWDNLTGDALSHSAYVTAKSFGLSLKHEHGRFLKIRYTDLFVGPDLEHTAKEIVGADRTKAVDAADAESGTRIGVTTKSNVYQGDVNVHVIEHFANGTNDTDWLLMDLSKPVKPMAIAVERDLEMIEQMAMDAEQRFLRDVFRASVEGDYAADGQYPHVIYGLLS